MPKINREQCKVRPEQLTEKMQTSEAITWPPKMSTLRDAFFHPCVSFVSFTQKDTRALPRAPQGEHVTPDLEVVKLSETSQTCTFSHTCISQLVRQEAVTLSFLWLTTIDAKKQCTLTFSTKLDTLYRVEKGEKESKVATAYDIPRGTLSTTLKNKQDIRVLVVSRPILWRSQVCVVQMDRNECAEAIPVSSPRYGRLHCTHLMVATFRRALQHPGKGHLGRICCRRRWGRKQMGERGVARNRDDILARIHF